MREEIDSNLIPLTVVFELPCALLNLSNANSAYDHQPSSPKVGAADTLLGVGEGIGGRLYVALEFVWERGAALGVIGSRMGSSRLAVGAWIESQTDCSGGDSFIVTGISIPARFTCTPLS